MTSSAQQPPFLTDAPPANAPFLHTGANTARMNIWTLGGLTLLAASYAGRYHPQFFGRYLLFLLMALILEAGYCLLIERRLGMHSGGTMISAAILLLALPPAFPLFLLAVVLFIAMLLEKTASRYCKITFNTALLARLITMLFCHERTVAWGDDIDGISSATPLNFFHLEGETWNLKQLFAGKISGNWEDLDILIPGSPGESFILLLLIIGLILYLKGIIDWRMGVAFLASFGLTCKVLNEPVLFNFVSGAAVFAAVFIATDPRSTPITRGARLTAGVIAGIINALVRHYQPGYYGEGIVFAFLTASLFSRPLDLLFFRLRARSIQKTWALSPIK